MIYDEKSITDEENVWLVLLEQGKFPYSSPADAKYAWMVQEQWRELLEAAVEHEHSDHWLSWLHLGVMYYQSKQFDKAKDAWQKSIEREASAMAYRNLAVIAARDGDVQKSADLLLEACKLSPGMWQLAAEYFQALLKAGLKERVIESYKSLCEELKNHGRLRYLMAVAAIELDDIETVEKLFEDGIVIADMQEGEVSLSDLWFRLQEKRVSAKENIPIDEKFQERIRTEFPPPVEIDFRMRT